MTTQRIEEHQISDTDHIKIQALFAQCFPEYPKERSFFKQVPSFRYLVWDEDVLVANLGVDHRMINMNDELVSIFGIVDLCVSIQFQSQQIASTLLAQLEELARQSNIDFLVLVTGEHQFYRKQGFELVQNTCRWLIINRDKSLGIGHRRISESLMVKPLGIKSWEEGLVDFLGVIF